MADLNIGNSSASVVVNAKHNGSVIPQINNRYDLGTSDLKWKNIYGATFVGSLNGNAATATNADKLDNKHANEFMYFNYDVGLGSGSPANIAKSYFVDNEKTPKGMIKGYYNDSGEEYSQLYSRSKVGNTGSILKWGYNDRYIRILRYRNGWQSEDWEKMNAGNADTATKLATARNITIGNKTNSFNGSANISYNLQDVLIRAGNEFNYTADGIAGLWFNYKTQTGTNSTTKITNYYFGNGQGGIDGVTINASNFSGNAATATKLATARTISLTGSVTGSGTFDGSGNLSIATTTNHAHAAATTSANGFMSSSDKSKLDGIATGANKYSHPTYTSRASGLYKITVDGTGHVSAATAVAKSDITALGIPSTNTTYSAMTGATTSAAGTAGLVPAPAKGAANRYLRSDGTWQVPPDTNTTYSVATTSSNGLMSSSDKTKLNNANINVYKMSNIDTVAKGSSNYIDIGFCSGYNNSFGGTYICISISWQGYAIQFRMGQGASTVKTRCTNTSKQWTAWH